MTDDDDQAIAHYRSEVVAEAELARGDLEEIEDHLRSLSDELRDGGMPRAQAIAEACRRLGDPRQVAREHARGRSPFGAKLSRARAWSAAAVLVTMLIVSRHGDLLSGGKLTPMGLELGLYVIALVALIARVGWARPIIVGSLVVTLVRTVVWSAISAQGLAGLPWLVGTAGALAFVMPWKRGEIRLAGLVLALLAPAYSAAMASMMFELTAPHGVMLANPFGTLALAGALVTGAGIVTRARWASLAAAGTAVALAVTAGHLWGLTVRLPDGAAYRAMVLGLFAVGCSGAAIASVLAWRTARSTFGTLRGVLG